MSTLPLSPDELLTTTRSVRKRLDLARPVPLDLVSECLEVALQAPSKLLGMPADIRQGVLIPTAYYTGDTFKPARQPLDNVLHINSW
jgi:nitroreductase